MRHIAFIALAALSILHFQLSTAQQRSPVVGLEGHVEYQRLIVQEHELARYADSVSLRMSELRANFRTDTLNRAANSTALLRMEEESFDIRTQMAHIAGRINAIEQDWILRNLLSENAPGTGYDADSGAVSGPTATGSAGVSGSGQGSGFGDVHGGRMTADLAHSSFFETHLSAEQWAELCAAQKAEAEVPRLIASYTANHRNIRDLIARYNSAKNETEAEKIKAKIDETAAANAALDAKIGEMWGRIFDSKGYIYNLTAEKHRFRELPEMWTRNLESARNRAAQLQNRSASEAALDYAIAKPLLVFFEINLAQTIGNEAAADSLLNVGASLREPEKLAAELSPLRFRERSFIEYSPVVQGGRTAVYSARNPIPNIRIHTRGVVYRVLVGTFSGQQGPAVFRNFSPLCVWRPGSTEGSTESSAAGRSPDGRFRYFAGAYRTEAEAITAVDKLRRAGFRNPVVTAWMDGVYFNVSESAAAGETDTSYHIELTDIQELTSEIKSLVGAHDIARSAGGFIVGPLHRTAAMNLRLGLETLRQKSDDFDLRLVKID